MSARARMAAPRETGTVLCGLAALALGVVAYRLGLPSWALAAMGIAVAGCALLGYRPLREALAAVAAAGLSGIALALDDFGPRPWLGGAALACGLVYWGPLLRGWWRRSLRPWLRRRWSRLWGKQPSADTAASADAAAGAPGARTRWASFAALVASSALAWGGALIGLAFVVGALMARRTQPIPLLTMYAALLALVTIILLLPSWWMRSYGRIVRRRPVKLRWAVLPGLLLVLGIGGSLHARDITNERDSPDLAQLREAALGRFDLLLVLDPADPASRRLIEAAKRDLQPTAEDPFGDRITKLLAPRVPDSPYDVAFGLAVAEPARAGEPLWRLVEPPTQDDRELAESLAAIPLPEEGSPSPGSYGRLLYDASIQQRVRWRDGAQRGVAFMLEGLPTEAELDRGGRGVETPDEDDPRHVCSGFDGDASELADGALPPSVQVTWGEALRRLCFERRSFGAWLEAGRPRASRQLPPISVFALTRERDTLRLDDWSTWTRVTGGRVHVLPPIAPFGRDAAVELVQDARDVFTGQPVDNLAVVVETFRPHLFFDESEKFAPVDVDWMLYPDARRPHEGTSSTIECSVDGDVETVCEQVAPAADGDTHNICDREQLTINCEPVQARASLAGALDDMIDFAGGARLGADVVRGDLDPPRMYVHVRQEEGRIFLGYWWYFRYNVSPWRTEVNCLPGLGFGGISCHDHEGDWEGVTVVLKPLRDKRTRDPYLLGNLAPEAVVYDAHGHSIRWEWGQVDLAADPSSYATHPVVYVATGSHASYPTGCRRSECDQRLSGEALGEGGFDGEQPWRFNSRQECEKPELSKDTRGPCLIALPSTDGGRRGVLWNAFPGAWGRARCTVVAKVCSQVDGPRSPSRQNRFKYPSGEKPDKRGELERYVKPGDRDVLDDMRRHYRRPHADEQRWPPQPWPVAAGEPLPATAELR